MLDYRPDDRGRWLVAVRDDALLMLPADRGDDLRALWPGLGSTDAAARVIDRLAAGGLASTPSFALVVRERAAGTARAVVRGPITVRLGDVEVSGEQVSTWQERVVGGAPAVRIAADGAGSGAPGADAPVPRDRPAMLPLVAGAVAAAVVEWPADDAGGQVASRAAAVPAPAVDRPDERTMVPDDTVVGFSRTERPSIPRASDAAAGGADAEAAASTVVIVPPPGIAVDASAAPQSAPARAGVLGDHDGLTVAGSDIRRLREARERERAASRPADGPDTAPALALRLPDGSIEPIVGELVLGRAPAIGRASGARMPRPVVIGAGDPDISRTHLRVAVEGGTAVVTDLESRNGTHVVAPGQPPVRLRPTEATPVLPDTVIDLGGGWSLQVVVR